MSPSRAILQLILITVVHVALNVSETNGFTTKLKNVCRFGTFCNYFVNGIRKTIYGLYNFNKEEPNYCLQKRIEECSCYEMLILEKLWIPNWPRLDELDVKRLRTQASKIYHPDHLDKDYDGHRIEPFIFLEKCTNWFKYPALRTDYRSRLEAPLNALVGLGTEDMLESFARNIIYEINIQFGTNHPEPDPNDVPKPGKPQSKEERTNETLHIFLDNSPTIKGETLEKGKRIFKTLQHRIFATPTNIYLIEKKARNIVNEIFVLDESNVNESVYDKWDGNKTNGGGYHYYLWEEIFFVMKDKKSTDCEIIIITDGYNAYRTGGSHSGFRGIQGLTKLMNELKSNGDGLCRTFVYCLSDDCKKEVGKSFMDLALKETIPTGGFSCDSGNFDDCNGILTASHAERVGFEKDLKAEHVRQVDDGKVLKVAYFNYTNEL